MKKFLRKLHIGEGSGCMKIPEVEEWSSPSPPSPPSPLSPPSPTSSPWPPLLSVQLGAEEWSARQSAAAERRRLAAEERSARLSAAAERRRLAAEERTMRLSVAAERWRLAEEERSAMLSAAAERMRLAEQERQSWHGKFSGRKKKKSDKHIFRQVPQSGAAERRRSQDNHKLQKDDTNHEVVLQDQSAESRDLQPDETTNLIGSSLSGASSRHDKLEVILQDRSVEPCDLRLHPESNESFVSNNNQLSKDDTTNLLGSSLNGASSRHDNNLEVVLQDESAEPCDLRLQYLIDITDNFSGKREVGRGGFGVVYKGMLENGAMVAVKNLMPTAEIQDEQFKNEIDNLMRVRHPNIVRFVGYCYETQMKYIEHNGKYIFAETPKRFLCFEYVPNGSLDRYISEESHGLDWHKRYIIIEGICCGLYYLHEDCQINGSIIHLDLKPANIMLDDNMVPKIADFGLSKFFDDQKTRTCATHRLGSRGYMAPEYLDQGTITTKADIYSLGVIIIDIVAGRKMSPYDTGETRSDFVELVLGNWRNRLEASPSCTSLERYYQQIQSCLEMGLSCVKFDPRERPSIREIIERLDINKA